MPSHIADPARAGAEHDASDSASRNGEPAPNAAAPERPGSQFPQVDKVPIIDIMLSSRDPDLPDRPAVVARSDPVRPSRPNERWRRAGDSEAPHPEAPHPESPRLGSRPPPHRDPGRGTLRTPVGTGTAHAPARTRRRVDAAARGSTAAPPATRRRSRSRFRPPPPGPPATPIAKMDNHRYPPNILQHFPFRSPAFPRIDLGPGRLRPTELHPPSIPAANAPAAPSARNPVDMEPGRREPHPPTHCDLSDAAPLPGARRRPPDRFVTVTYFAPRPPPLPITVRGRGPRSTGRPDAGRLPPRTPRRAHPDRRGNSCGWRTRRPRTAPVRARHRGRRPPRPCSAAS